MKIYYFRTTAVNEFDASARLFPCRIGKKGVEELIIKTKKQAFDTQNWDDLKMLERTILSVGKEAEMTLLTQESSYYGKKYIGIAY